MLYRSYALGRAKHNACLGDYSYLIQALLDQFESDFNSRWIDTAVELQNIQDRELWDPAPKVIAPAVRASCCIARWN